jgi:hypothetical protein
MHVATADGLGWAAIANGELLHLAEAEGFDIIVTAEQNLTYRQNLVGRNIGLVVLGTNRWPTLRRNVELVVEALASLLPGGFCIVEFD